MEKIEIKKQMNLLRTLNSSKIERLEEENKMLKEKNEELKQINRLYASYINENIKKEKNINKEIENEK